MRRAILVALAVGALSCSNPTRHGGSGGSGGTGGGGSGGGGRQRAAHDRRRRSIRRYRPASSAASTAAAPGTSGITLVYPNAGALVPHDLAPIDVQWNGARRSTASPSPSTTATSCAATSRAPTGTPASNWAVAAGRAAGHQNPLSVDGATIDANGTPQGAVARLGRAAAGGLARRRHRRALLLRDHRRPDLRRRHARAARARRAEADKYLNKTNDGNGQCVGCHALSRDGTRVAFTFLDLLGAATGTHDALGSVDATNPAAQQADRRHDRGDLLVQPRRQADSSPAYDSKLSIRDAVTGALVMDCRRRARPCFPTGRPTARRSSSCARRSACTPGQPNFGQASIYAYGGSIVTLTTAGGTWGNETVLCPPPAARTTTTRPSRPTESGWRSPGLDLDEVELVGGQHVLHRPGRQRPVLRQPVGDHVDHARRRRRAPELDRGQRRADEDQLVAQVEPQARRRLSVAVVLVDPSIRQRAHRANAHHQIWITAIPRAQETPSGDPSTPAVWFPFQDTTTKNHIGVWSLRSASTSSPERSRVKGL